MSGNPAGFDFASLTPEQQQQARLLPALEPPDGITPILNNPPNENVYGYFTLSLCLSVATIALFARLYTRVFIVRQHFLGDYLLVAAYGLFMGNLGMIYALTDNFGLFIHQWNVQLGNLSTFIRTLWLASSIYYAAIGSIKAAILLEWLRIFVPAGNRNFMFWACHSLIWISSIFSLTVIIALNINCTPYEYHWNKLIEGNCDRVDTEDLNLGSAVFNLATDIAILLLPQHVIWKLRLPKAKQRVVALIFAIGLAGCAAATGRVVVAYQLTGSRDFTYNYSSVILLGIAEITCAMLVISVPAIPKALKEAKSSSLFANFLTFASASRQKLSAFSGSNSQSETETESKLPSKGESSWPRDVEPGSKNRTYDGPNDYTATFATSDAGRRVSAISEQRNEHSSIVQPPMAHSDARITGTTHFDNSSATTLANEEAVESEYRQQHPSADRPSNPAV